jgi:hypothetical protein
MGERQTTYIRRILQSKWLGLMLLALGVLQLLVALGYIWLFPNLVNQFPFQDLIIVVYAIIALAILILLSLVASLRLLFRHKNEEELGIAVFGLLLDVIILLFTFNWQS